MGLDNTELVQMLNGSHERFIEAILRDDGRLMLIAYKNYVSALAIVLGRLSG